MNYAKSRDIALEEHEPGDKCPLKALKELVVLGCICFDMGDAMMAFAKRGATVLTEKLAALSYTNGHHKSRLVRKRSRGVTLNNALMACHFFESVSWTFSYTLMASRK